MKFNNRLTPISHAEMEDIRVRRAQAQVLKSRYAYLSRFNALIFIGAMAASIMLILQISVFSALTVVPDWTYQALVGVACALAASMIVGFYLNINLRHQTSLSRDLSFYTAIQDERMWQRLEQCPRVRSIYRRLLSSQGLIYQYQIDALREELLREEGADVHSRFHLKVY